MMWDRWVMWSGRAGGNGANVLRNKQKGCKEWMMEKTKSAGVKRMNWTICGTFHKYASVSTHWLSIDPPIGRGFARSLVPIMANNSHQRLGPTVLMSHLWRLALLSLHHGFIFQLIGSFINLRVSCSLGRHQSPRLIKTRVKDRKTFRSWSVQGGTYGPTAQPAG